MKRRDSRAANLVEIGPDWEVCERELVRGVTVATVAAALPVRAVDCHATRRQAAVVVDGSGVHLGDELTRAAEVARLFP